MAAGSPAIPTGNPANPGSSLSSIFQFLKQFAGGAGPAAQAAGTPGQQGGGGQQPVPQPVQNPSLMPGQPNGILESIGRALLGKAGSPGSQDTTQLKKAIDDHMKVLDQQKKAAQHIKKAVTSGPPQAQQDVSAPFHDLFHSVMSGLQS